MKPKNKLDKFLLMNWKSILFLAISWLVAVILHNLVYAWLYSKGGGDEAFFFIIANVIIPLYFLISLIYTLVVYFRRKKYKNKV